MLASFAYFLVKQILKMPVGGVRLKSIDWVLCATFLIMMYVIQTRNPNSSDIHIDSDPLHCLNPQQENEAWRTLPPQKMSKADIFKYLEWSNSTSCIVSYDFGGVVVHKGAVGVDGQKSVCMDPGAGPKTSECLVYSFGVSTDWSFEDTFGRYGCELYSFDPKAQARPQDNNSSIHFHRITLSDHNQGDDVKTLSSIYNKFKSQHGERMINYVRIDIGQNELNILTEMLASGILRNVKQVGVQVYFEKPNDLEYFQNVVKVLRSVEDYGMIRFQSRPYLFAPGTVLGRDDYLSYEFVWYQAKFYKGFRNLFT